MCKKVKRNHNRKWNQATTKQLTKGHGQTWGATGQAQEINLWMRQRTCLYPNVRFISIACNFWAVSVPKPISTCEQNARICSWLVHHKWYKHLHSIVKTIFIACAFTASDTGFGLVCNFWALCCCYLRYPERLQQSTFRPTKHVSIFYSVLCIGYILARN